GVVAPDGRRTVARSDAVFEHPFFAPALGLVVWDGWTDGRVLLTGVRQDRLRQIPERSGRDRRGLAVRADGRWAAIGEHSRVLLWDMRSWELAATLPGHQSTVLCGRFSRDGDVLVTGDAAGAVRVWHLPPA